jgi:uncharacterized protein YoxC
MQDQDGLATTTLYAGITPQTAELLQAFWTVVEPNLQAILDAFYVHVTQDPDLRRLVGDQTPRLKLAQAEHWRRLFSGRFDAAFLSSARAVGLAHSKIGLEPRRYVGGYNFVLNRLTALAIRRHRWSPDKLHALIAAVNTAVMLDMGLAITAYHDADVHEREERGRRVNTLLQDFEAKTGALVATVATAAGDLRTTAQALSSRTDETTQQASSVAAAVEEASVNVQTVAAAAEELSTSIGEIARQVSQSAEMAGKAVADARRTDAIVKTLAEGAQRIGDVVGLISSIAGQTNLLALNATIEAARAGDAGKGFAVVASEVKSLANQTAKATGDISQQIAEIQSATTQAVQAIEAIAGTIGELSSIAAGIAAAVEQQGAATQEIARSAQRAAQGSEAVAQNLDALGGSADRTGTGAARGRVAAEQLSTQCAGVADAVHSFVATIRAG